MIIHYKKLPSCSYTIFVNPSYKNLANFGLFDDQKEKKKSLQFEETIMYFE